MRVLPLGTPFAVPSILQVSSSSSILSTASVTHFRARLIAPRDDLTSRVLRSALPAHPQKVMYLGNPMMDPVKDPSFDLALTRSLRAAFPGRDWVTLLPGTRDPEVYRNTTVILKVCAEAIYLFESSQTLAFMFPVPSSCR